MEHLNPYELLGVSPYAPAPEVRRAYYQLALLAHPDKGGSASDMATVHAAYNYVIARAPAAPLAPNAELAERAKNAAREFTEFLAAQRTEKMLPLNEILANAFGLTEASFVADYLQPALDAAATDAATDATTAHDRAVYANVAYQTVVSRAHAQLANADSFGCNHSAIIAELTTDFVATTHAPGSARCFPAAIAGGYGDVMEPAGLMPRTGPLTPFPERQVIHYAEPNAFVPPAGQSDQSRPADVEMPESLDDYTVHSALTDYRAAYTAPEPFPPFSAAAAAAPVDLLTAYERLVADRIAEDLENSMDIVESR